MVIALSMTVIAAAWALLFLGVDPVPTWFYVLAWYPTLAVLDRIGTRLGAGPSLLGDPRRALSLFAWSPVIWLVFEAANFRLRNWYYVFLPGTGIERWAGIVISFATVVPAIILTARLLEGIGLGVTWRSRPVRVRSRHLHAATALGALCAGLALAAPTLFFPLVWAAAWLLLEPYVYRRRPEWSLFADIGRGEWGRIARVMTGGLLVGILWECYNFWARGKWIYTLPWLDDLRLFEMPVLGFLGFPFFALEAWALYHALCAAGFAVAPFDIRAPSARQLLPGALIASLFGVATLAGMERLTISSTVPRLADLPGVTPDVVVQLRAARLGSVFDLAELDAAELARRSGLPHPTAERLQATTQLVTTRGIGTRHAATLNTLGIVSVCQLADHEPASLWEDYRKTRVQGAMQDLPPALITEAIAAPPRPTQAEVREWVAAASRACRSSTGVAPDATARRPGGSRTPGPGSPGG